MDITLGFVLDGLRKLGFRVSENEAQRYVHLWRYVGWLLGTDHELLFATESEGLKLADLIMKTQCPADEDSRALTKALFESGARGAKTEEDRKHVERMAPVVYALARHLLGGELADSLGVVPSRFVKLMPAVKAVIHALDGVRERVHLLDMAAVQIGTRYWDNVVTRGLGER